MERVLRAGRHEQAGGGALLPPPALQIQSPAARKECPPCCLPAFPPPPPPPPHTTPTRAVLGPKSISFSRGAYDQARVEKRCKQRGRGEGICVPAGKARCTCSTCPHGIPLTTSSSHAALAVPPASGLVPPPPSLTFLSAFQCLISKNRTLPAGGTVGSGDTTKAWARARLQALGRALPQLLPCRPPTSGRQPKPPAHRYPPGGMLRSWLVRRVTAEGGSPAQPSPAPGARPPPPPPGGAPPPPPHTPCVPAPPPDPSPAQPGPPSPPSHLLPTPHQAHPPTRRDAAQLAGEAHDGRRVNHAGLAPVVAWPKGGRELGGREEAGKQRAT